KSPAQAAQREPSLDGVSQLLELLQRAHSWDPFGMRIVALLAGGRVTTLGPVPSTTGVSAIPAGKPGAEAQLGAVPSFYLSSSASTPHGAGTGQAAVLLEPDRFVK